MTRPQDKSRGQWADMLWSLLKPSRCLFLSLLLVKLPVVWGYEWDNWNYYELLGIHEREIDDKTIKQAYRREAKLYHPDKHQNSKISQEEATERFRRIAEAYEVLSDPEQRALYNSYLKEQTNAQNLRTESSSSSTDSAAASSKFFSWETFRDPFKVFEDFFFAQEEDEDFEDAWFRNTASDPWSNANENADQERTLYYDPLFGQVLRVVQRDYDPESASFSVLYQDFVEDWDPHWGTWGWYPVQPEPSVVHPSRGLQRPLAPPAFLQSGHFVAGIFENCQFQIRRGTNVIWHATELDDRFSRGEMCRLGLQGSQLTVQTNTRILWSSPMCPQEIQWHQSRYRRTPPDFISRLDDDGSLTVYHTRRRRRADDDDDSSRLLDQVKAVLWKNPDCCFSTNPAGCYRIGRLFIRLVTFNHRLDGLLAQMAHYVHLVLDWLEDESV